MLASHARRGAVRRTLFELKYPPEEIVLRYAFLGEGEIVLGDDAEENLQLLQAAAKWGVHRARLEAPLQGGALLNIVRYLEINTSMPPESLALFKGLETLRLTDRDMAPASLPIMWSAVAGVLADSKLLPHLVQLDLELNLVSAVPVKTWRLFWEAVDTRPLLTHVKWTCRDWTDFDSDALPMLHHLTSMTTNCPFIRDLDAKLPTGLREYHGTHNQVVFSGKIPHALQGISVTSMLVDLLTHRAKTLELFQVEVPSAYVPHVDTSAIKMERLHTFMVSGNNWRLAQFAMNHLLGPSNETLTSFGWEMPHMDPVKLPEGTDYPKLLSLVEADPSLVRVTLQQMGYGSLSTVVGQFCAGRSVRDLTLDRWLLRKNCLEDGLPPELTSLTLSDTILPLDASVLALPLERYTRLQKLVYNTSHVHVAVDAKRVALVLPLFPPTLYEFSFQGPELDSYEKAFDFQHVLLEGLAGNRGLVTFSCTELRLSLAAEYGRGPSAQDRVDRVRSMEVALVQLLAQNKTLVRLDMHLMVGSRMIDIADAIRKNRTLEFLSFRHERHVDPEVMQACVQNRLARQARLAAHAAFTMLRAMNRTARDSALRLSLQPLLPSILKLTDLPSNMETNRTMAKLAETFFRMRSDLGALAAPPAAAQLAIERDHAVEGVVRKRKRT